MSAGTLSPTREEERESFQYGNSGDSWPVLQQKEPEPKIWPTEHLKLLNIYDLNI